MTPLRSWSTAGGTSIPEITPSRSVFWLLKTPRVVSRTTFIDVVTDNIETRHQITAESAKITASLYWRCPKCVLLIFYDTSFGIFTTLLHALAKYWVMRYLVHNVSPWLLWYERASLIRLINDENLVWSLLHLPKILGILWVLTWARRSWYKKRPLMEETCKNKHYKTIYIVWFIENLRWSATFCWKTTFLLNLGNLDALWWEAKS